MLPDRDLERELRELGAHVDYPPTPDLARAVRNRLDEGEEPAPRWGWSLPALRWVAVAAAFLLIVATPALSPALRSTVTGWFEGGQAASGPEGEASPADEVTMMMEDGDASRADVPQSGGRRIMPGSGGGARPSAGGSGYGERISLREARDRVAYELLLPGAPGLGDPDEVYAGEPPNGKVVTLVYSARPGLPPLGDTGIGLFLTELPGGIESAYLPEGTSLETVQVGGERGYWAPAGRGVPSPVGQTGRLGGSVLLWEREGVALRLQADVSKREAIRIAESVR
jgi:hypothetical protein